MDNYTLPWVLEERDRLVSEGVGIAHKYASRFYRGDSEAEDIRSSAIFGLIEAADRWVDGRVSKEKGFHRVALHYIRRAVCAYVFGNRNSIKIPTHTQVLLRKYERFARRFSAEKGRNPTVAEAGKEFGWKRRDRAKLSQALKVRRAKKMESDSLEDTSCHLGIFRVDDRDEVEAGLAAMTQRQREAVVAWAEGNGGKLGVSQQAVSRMIGRGASRARKGVA